MIKYKKQQSYVLILAKKTLGILLLIIGIIGLFLPFLQGIALITGGLLLLGNKKTITYYKQYYKQKILHIKNRLHSFFKKTNNDQ